MDTTSGLHHVTAICADAQRNLDFYTGILGLRLVKLTVNFDDPFSYHLYYGDELGRPGTILTFFAWSGGAPARHGNRAVAATALAVPVGALEWWKTHLIQQNVAFTTPDARYGENLLQFHDPDGLVLEIVESSRASAGLAWEKGPVSVENAIRGLHSVTIAAEAFEHTARVLSGLGFKTGQTSPLDPNRARFESGQGIGSIVDIACLPDAPRATTGAGGMHHIAFRVADDGAQTRFRAQLAREGFNVSPVMDRTYFHSIYFREPGGVLLELATDNPGFTFDESAADLGTKLQLPTQLEAYRGQIETRTAKLQFPARK